MRAACAAFTVSLALAAAGAAAPPAADCTAVPGWSQKGGVRHFVPDNLFDYMDGNAEGYILYGFQNLTGVTCQSGEASIVIDISEMSTPEMAYGIFSANRHPRFPVQEIGTAGQIMPRRATFAKGNYYVELAANGGEDFTAALTAFVQDLVTRVPGATERPAILGWFPKEGLEAGSVRLVPQSVLGLRMLKRGYIARYDYGRAFIVTEDSPEAAAAVLEKFKERLGETEAAEVADGGISGSDRYLGRMCVARKGRYVLGFASLKEGEDGVARARALAASIP